MSVSCTDLRVSFSSGGRQFTALNHVDFEIQEGEIVGVAGPSGSGKSTLVKLVLGLIPNYEGSAKLFGVEVRDIDKKQLAELIAYVPQSPFLIKGSVRENVCYAAKMRPSDEEIRQALDKARVLAKVETLGDGNFKAALDSMVHEQGRNFSGGERQRFALARLFLSKPKLVVLDEPTAALDTENQALVQSSISELTRGKSAMIVAHRLNTLQQTNRIIVLEHGRVVQNGSYAELANSDGLFRTLIEREQLEQSLLGSP